MENTNTSNETKSPQATGDIKTIKVSKNDFEELYVKKDFKGAAEYLLRNKQQIDSGIFHYNLGTVYSKLGDYPAARFHLEKAIKEGYVNSASLNNLNFIKAKLSVDDLSTSTSFPDQAMNVALSIPPVAFMTLSLILLLCGISLLKRKRLVRKMSIFIFALLVLAPVGFSKLYLENINYAVAFKDVTVYEGPSKIFTEKGKVRAGSKIILGEFKEGWFFIKYPMSLTGWINKDQLGLY